MDTVLSIVVVLALAAPVGAAAAWFSTRGADALAVFFRPGSVAELGWPHGVQEEEPTAWNWDRGPGPRAGDRSLDGAEPATLTPVAFRVRPGSARQRRGWR
jgi:hypothetical protein